MNISVVRIGNSRGIRIPQRVLAQCRVEDALEMSVKGDKIVLSPIRNQPRHDWEEAAKKMRRNDDDQLLLPDVLPEDSHLEW